MATGYLHPLYAQSLREFGTPRYLLRSGGWILERAIPGTPYRDAMGCYPLFACRDWTRLAEDLAEITDLVSLGFVADPFGNYTETLLRGCFPDAAFPFKQSRVADLSLPPDQIASRHHRYYARRALRRIAVQVPDAPLAHLDEWTDLYNSLIDRHQIHGIKAFSHAAFAQQLATPGLTMLRAVMDGAAVAAQLWYVQGDVAYSHLTAANAAGYALRAQYALYWFAIHHFQGQVRWLNWGAGAGLESGEMDGLSHFKTGWATDIRPAWFCGRIFNRAAYEEIVQGKRIDPAVGYFPAYRAGEMV